MGGVIAGLLALGPRRLLALALVGAAVLGGVAWLALRATEPPMATLFTDLESRDAAAVVAALERARTPYRLAAGGTTVLALEGEVPRLRLLLARDGLPAGGGVGWEIFDRGESLTTTPFQQELNRLRALEGELARTIRGLAGVRSARVHLVLPRREAFSRERAEAQASVVLSMQGAQRLDRDGVQAVLHLVATAVPGLKPANVSIVDSRGALLARGGQALAGAGGAALTQEEVRRGQELRVARGVEELLERTLGAGKVRAEATVEFDFDRVETREERFDAENQVPRSTQSVSEQNRGVEPQTTSVATNLPGAEAGTTGGSSENRQEETTNFEIGKSTRNTLREHPVVRRISIAVLVDGVTEAGPDGTPRVRERTAEEVARIASLVRAAAGLDERRGDRVEVVSMAFAETDTGSPAAPAGLFGLPLAVSPVLLARLAESGTFALVALAAILFIGRPVAKRLMVALVAPALATGAAPGTPALPGTMPDGEGTPALSAAEELVSLAHVQGQLRASSVTGLTRLFEQHPEESLAVLRRWLSPESMK